MRNKTMILPAAVFLVLAAQASAALYSIEWSNETGQAPFVNANTVIASAANTTGSAASDFRQGLTTYDHNVTGGWLRFGSHVGLTAITTSADLETHYWTFTVSADPSYTLNLNSLSFDARRATDNNNSPSRGFELWATTNGEAFDIAKASTQRLVSVFSPVPDPADPESPHLDYLGNRSAGATSFNLDLSGAEYQGLESITFRVYHLSEATTFNGVEFGDVTLSGQVIPEPSVALLSGFAAFALLRRRR